MNDLISPNAGVTASEGWWAIYTRHQHEKVVADMLVARGFDIFLPLFESTRQWKDRRKTLSLPLFPCYLFIHGGLERRLQVVTTPGVHMVLYRGDHVAMVPQDEIEAVQRALASSVRVEPHPYLKCGMRVRVIRGPIEGVQGILVRKKNLCRLVISVDMLSQSVAVEVNACDVEPIGPGAVDASVKAPPVSDSQGRQPRMNPASAAL
jgi:transcription antitermination factor NusG